MRKPPLLGALLPLVVTASALAGGDHAHGGHAHGHAHAGGHDRAAEGHVHAEDGGHDPGPRHPRARHGGVVLEEAGYLFEVTMRDEGIRVHPMNAAGEPVPVGDLGGTVLLKARRGRNLRLPLEPVDGPPEASGYLEAARDLSAIRDGSRTVIASLTGIPGHPGRAHVWTRFERTRPAPEASGHGHPHGVHGHGAHGHEHGDHGHPHPE